VYADARLVNESDGLDEVVSLNLKTVAQYDDILKAHTKNGEVENGYELTLLQREFVNNIGYSTLQYFANSSLDNAKVLNWLVEDEENLTEYLLGGKPDGSYYDSLTTLVRLYNSYAGDMDDQSPAEYAEGTKGDLYKRMIITLSLTHSASCGLWAGGMTGNIEDPNDSDAVERYRIYKKMYLAGKLDTQIFETRSIEEMRFVMNAIIDDESIEWLRDYTYNNTSGGKRNPYTYITYMFGYNYSKEEYYSEENYDKWNEKYKLEEYGITYKSGFPKMWIVFEENGVCGAIAKTGTVIQNSYGVPATVVGQPGHAAYIYQSLNSDGRTVWNLYNDVSGWANSGRTEKIGVRMINGWGEYNVATYTSTIKPDTYVFLAQEALDDYATYEAAEKILMLANVYSGDADKQEEIYRRALEVEPINFDALYGLVTLYRDTNRSEEDCFALAQQIAQTYTYHPLPMYDLLRILRPLMPSAEYDVKFTLLQTKALTAASKATSRDSVQYSGVIAIAKALLGTVDTTVATFSFDGDNANKIILADRYTGNGVRWDYSIDGGETWTATSENFALLSQEEIESITTENGIRIHIVGTDYEEENIYRIEITKAGNPSGICANDLENKLIGVSEAYEWRLKDGETWKCFGDESPDLTGDVEISIRKKASGTQMAGNEVTYTFTEDDLPDNRKYVSVSHLSLVSVSSEQTGNDNYAKYAIDGNINTMWHTAWDGSDTDRYIVVKFDEPVYLSAMEYVPRQSGSNGRAKSAVLYVSMDGENWEEAGSGLKWADSSAWKTIELDEPIETQYVKLVITAYYGDGRSFASAAMLNFYADTTLGDSSDEPEEDDTEESKPETGDKEENKPETGDMEESKPETGESEPEESEPEESEPEESEPEESEPEESEPEESEPEESEPEGSEPEESEPEGSEPEESEPEESEPEESEPEESEPEESEPEGSEPEESEPEGSEPEESEPEGSEPEESEPEESKPEGSEPEESEPEESEPEKGETTPPVVGTPSEDNTEEGKDNNDGNNNASSSTDNNNDGTVVSDSELQNSTVSTTTVSWSTAPVATTTRQTQRKVSDVEILNIDNIGNINDTEELPEGVQDEAYDVLDIINVDEISKLYDSYDFSDTQGLLDNEYDLAELVEESSQPQIVNEEQVNEAQINDAQISEEEHIKEAKKSTDPISPVVPIAATGSIGLLLALAKFIFKLKK
jgi:hypothetical protein